MAYYDAGTKTAAQAALGRPLALFVTPTDDPSINGYADALFLQNRLRDHVASLVSALTAAYPTIRMEVLLPLGRQLSSSRRTSRRAGRRPVEQLREHSAGLGIVHNRGLRLPKNRSAGLRQHDTEPGLGEQCHHDGVCSVLAQRCAPLPGPRFWNCLTVAKRSQSSHTRGLSDCEFVALDHICLYGWGHHAASLRRPGKIVLSRMIQAVSSVPDGQIHAAR
jgi:hypothetical protein